MSDCVFCKIVAKQIPATMVHEDQHTVAFMDLGQVNPGHVLVAAKAHVENLYGLDDVNAAAVFRTVARVACAIRNAFASAPDVSWAPVAYVSSAAGPEAIGSRQR
jgi:histidine triad (HIT) family protein